MRSRWWVFVRRVLAGLLVGVASVPAGLLLVWWLGWGSVAPEAMQQWGGVTLLLGVAGWIVWPTGGERPPAPGPEPVVKVAPVVERTPASRLVGARARRQVEELEALLSLPARRPPHDYPLRPAVPEQPEDRHG